MGAWDPNNTIYSCTKSGWFDSATFGTWFFKQFVPSTQALEGPIALIGDNLGSHFSPSILKYCDIHNICFMFATKFYLSLQATGCDCI